ncbi:MAG TPA: hypothetical protein VGK13_04350 [Methanocellaceae archaeon]
MEDNFSSILQKSIKKLSNSPVLLLAGILVGILSLSGLAIYGHFDTGVQDLASVFAVVVLPLIIMPFIVGGALGYALEARQKDTSSMKTFIDSGAKHYVKLFLGGIVAFLAFYFLIFTLALAFAIFLSAPLIGVLLLAGAVVLSFIGLMTIEFYDIAIVADGANVREAFFKSIDFARRNMAQVAVFFIIIVLAKYILVQIPLIGGATGEYMTNSTFMNMTSSLNASLNSTMNSTFTTALSTPITFGAPSLIMVAILQVIIQGFVFAFVILYKTEFYLTVKDRRKITDFDYSFDEKKP